MKRGSGGGRRFRIPTPTQKKPKTSPATTPASSGSDEASLLARLQPSVARPAAEPNGGFKTAAVVAATPPSDEPPAQPFRSAAAAAPEEARESPTNIASPAAPPAQDENATTTSLELQVVGLRYRDGRRFLREGVAVTLRREANEHDANAIEAWIPGDLAPVQLGFLRRGAAAALAPLIDAGVVAVVSCVCRAAAADDAFDVSAVTTLRGPAAVLADIASALDVGEASLAASRRDCEDAAKWAERHGDAPMPRLGWDPSTGATTRDGSVVREYRAPGDAVPLGWVPYGDVGTVDADARERSWPPADAALAKLGLAPTGDAKWYASLGLRPPQDWRVEAPLDNLASTTRDVRKIRDKLDGAVHGANGCFLDSFLDEIRARVAGESFWCRDSDFEAERDAEQSEKLVACIGAPMVIGDATARLLKARRHDDLSRKICRALGVVYAAAHLCPVAAPGFNSLIISARRRGSGFWWHQDQVPQQAAQTTLAPRQAVATLILYEKQADAGADCVRWKPVQNWDDTGLEKKLGAARTLPTTDALVHLQREGLQPHAKHAVHHTPGAPPRAGARIVVTARIAKLDAWDAVDVPAVREMPAIGPDGDVTLPLVWG
jgi:hypothetical protein